MSNKKDAALNGLTKKERRALEAREQELAAELAKREAKVAKKGKKKSKGKPAPTVATAEEREAKKPKKVKATAPSQYELAIAIADETDDVEVTVTEPDAEEPALDDETAAIKARVDAKRNARQALADAAPNIDRDDQTAVDQYNAALAELGGGEFLTSTATKADNGARLQSLGATGLVAMVKEVRELRDNIAAQVAEVVETETGTIIAVGSEQPDAEPVAAFAKPSEAPRSDFETNGNGQYKIKRPSDGKLVGYTRATTYIDGLEYTGQLEKWKMRVLLEGVVANEELAAADASVTDLATSRVRDLVHNRDTAERKARKADRKGKLEPGQLADIVNSAWGDYKKAIDALADELLELGGVHAKANKGTDLHALTETYDSEGMAAIDALLAAETITPADRADVQAYADAMTAAGIKVVAQEQVIVNDALKVAGRLDRIVMARFPGTARAVKVVGDIKTGRIDYSAGKIGQQIELYSSGEAYDLDTHERTPLGVSRTKGIVIHLPAGEARCTIHPVDLTLGKKGNAIVAQVRAWRTEGKKAIDTATNLADPSTHVHEGTVE